LLCLSRRTGEKVILRDEDGRLIAEILITYIDRGKVRLGIKADHSVKIYRDEIDEQIKHEGKMTANKVGFPERV